MGEPNGHREHLERRAAEVRSRLEQRLHSIDERGHRAAELARAAARPPTSILILAAVGVAATLFVVQRVRARRARPRSLADLLRSVAPPQKSFLVQGLEKAAGSLVTVAIHRIGERGLEELLAQPQQPEPPLPVQH